MNIALAGSCFLPDGTVPSSRGTPTRSISVGCDDGAFRVPKESLAEGSLYTLNSKHYTLNTKLNPPNPYTQ
jgi:hypothetical protein